MATFANNLTQQTNEIHTYTVDFTNDLPAGGTVTAGTATHTPPSGSAGTIAVSVTSPYVYATVPALSLVGSHYIDVLATFNNGDKSSARLPINIVYPSPVARIGMASLIAELRGLTEASPSDYIIAGNPYWVDAQLQDVLDIHRVDVIFEPLQSYPVQVGGGSISYKDYRSGYGYFEATTGGSAIFYLQDSTGAVIASSNYTPDYRRGQVQFSADQAGTTYYLNGRSYDLDAAAADIWRRKAAHYAPGAFDFSTDNHSIRRSQVYQHCIEMAKHFEGASTQAVTTVSMFRGDMD
jgi:hypothetical protein